MNNNNERPVLYLNNLKKTGNSIELKLVGAQSNRSAIGATVRLTADGKTMTRQVEAGSGYASEMMLPVHFGLGNAQKVDEIEIRWPSGQLQRLQGDKLEAMIKGSRELRIEEGSDALTRLIDVRAH